MDRREHDQRSCYGAVFVNVMCVSWPATICTAAERPARLILVGAAGVPVMADTDVPFTAVSVTVTAPTGNVIALPHVPFGAAPAATVAVWPATLNVKLVPAVIPVPATLQIVSVPLFAAVAATFVNVILLCWSAVICVDAERAGRLTLVGAGVPAIAEAIVPAEPVSLTVTAPTASVIGALHVPSGPAPAATVAV